MYCGSATATSVRVLCLAPGAGMLYKPSSTASAPSACPSGRLSTTAYAPPAAIQALNISPQVSSGGTAPSSVPGASSQAALPGNGLLQLNPNGGPGPLVEGDPRFTNYRQWLSSDALLAQLAYDPATVQKRLGDGFYEQKLVRDQVAQLTGRRFLQGYGDDEVQ